MSNEGHVSYLAPRIVAALADPDGPLEHAIGTWVAYSLRFGRVYEVEYVKTGNDVSAHVHPTDRVLGDLPLETVGDFLAQATGVTFATYLPGAGIDAETYEEALADRVREVVAYVVDSALRDAPASVREAFDADDDPYGSIAESSDAEQAQYDWQEAYALRPLRPIIQRYEFAARRRRQLEEEQARAQEEQLASRKRLAGPLLQLLATLVPGYVEAKRAQALWNACAVVAAAAESEEQWRAFVEEAPNQARLSNSLRLKFSQQADAVWTRLRSGKAE